MQQCFVRVWPGRALQPSSESRELRDPRPLDREFLQVSDASVSRGANAPLLEGRGPSQAMLKVPDGCVSRIVVIEGAAFEDLQHGLPPGPAFQVAPTDITRRFCLVNGPDFSLYLGRSLRSDGPTHHLVSLPLAVRLGAGAERVLDLPAIVVVGEGAVELLLGETVLPRSQATLPAAHSFRIPNTGVSKASALLLDDVENAPLAPMFRIGESDSAFPAEDLDRVGAEVLAREKLHYAFVPALADEQDSRLLLFYERQDGATRALVSDSNVNAWLQHIEGVLASADFPIGARSTSALPASLPPRGTTIPPPGSLSPPEFEPRQAVVNSGGTAQVLPEAVVFGAVQTRNADFAGALVSARYAAEGDLGLFILGETGTGKEYLARAVHEASARAKGPFVAVNCASIPEGLIESELFGHKKGAFSGTQSDREGAFVSANGGTLLLDEIGDAPLRVQFALLRVLESRMVKPVGADHERPVDVRVMAATSRDVPRLMREQKLREDLYFRLAEQCVVVPPLRERVCDIRQLAEAMLERLGCEKALTSEALSLLERYRWPGNVRELGNALRRAAVIGRDRPALSADCFPHLDQVVTSFGEDAPPFDFPDMVRGVAMLVWKDQDLAATGLRTKYERRAIQRAALLYLATVYQVRAFPAPLLLHWSRLFGNRWATSENGRGPRELLRVLGVLPTDRGAIEWVIGKVGRG